MVYASLHLTNRLIQIMLGVIEPHAMATGMIHQVNTAAMAAALARSGRVALYGICFDLFNHREKRFVRKDGTVSYLGQRFEVPYVLLSGKTVMLVVDPHVGATKPRHATPTPLRTPESWQFRFAPFPAQGSPMS